MNLELLNPKMTTFKFVMSCSLIGSKFVARTGLSRLTVSTPIFIHDGCALGRGLTPAYSPYGRADLIECVALTAEQSYAVHITLGLVAYDTPI